MALCELVSFVPVHRETSAELTTWCDQEISGLNFNYKYCIHQHTVLFLGAYI
jgi:hypothetical protein